MIGPEIPLSTRKGRQIPNEQAPQWPEARMEAARSALLPNRPNAMIRSLRSVYNCMGMVFAARRTSIDPEHLGMILEDDEYRQVASESELEIGDLVVYRGDDNQVSHVGIISRIDPDLRTGSRRLSVVSQWGRDGEYIHEISDVSHYLGRPAEFWTDRT